MFLIFGLSTDAGSPRHTSRIIGPLLRWLNPNVSERTIHDTQVAIRKTAHVTEYAVLAWLVWRARRKQVRNDPRPWNWSDAAFALGFAVLYAASDEWHQTFVPSREGTSAMFSSMAPGGPWPDCAVAAGPFASPLVGKSSCNNSHFHPGSRGGRKPGESLRAVASGAGRGVESGGGPRAVHAILSRRHRKHHQLQRQP